MTSRKFIIITLVIYAFIAAVIITFNYISDDFGLFRSHESRRIWGREKTSKYLMSFKYIPENFDALLVGSSVSANMDPSSIESYKVYNLSMDGGNISELIFPLEVAIESGNIKAVIFCLYYYTTKNSGLKGNQLNKKEYWGSLYSLLPYEILKRKLRLLLGKAREKDAFKFSSNGYNNFNHGKKQTPFDILNDSYMKNPKTEMHIDETALIEFKSAVSKIRKKNIKIYGFYFPIYKEWFEVYVKNGEWSKYKDSINSIFNLSEDKIIDMNLPEFDFITRSKECYTDGHLSEHGANKVINSINEFLTNQAPDKYWELIHK
jgi:hypothetical protein